MHTQQQWLLPEDLTGPTVEAFVVQTHCFTKGTPFPQTLDAQGVKRANSAGIGLLLWLDKHTTLENLPEALRKEIDAVRAVALPTAEHPHSSNALVTLGKRTCDLCGVSLDAIAYIGELLWYWGQALVMPHRFRWGDCRLAFYHCGVQALPVVGLIGFLLGLILAFQSAMPLQMFGAEGFVGGLIGIALVRELGLIITAILVTGRSGSAFAAELGTMKVNEEIDALETMGLQPVRFLVLPRVVAGTFALPILALFATLTGILGGWLVMRILGFSTSYFIDQIQSFVAIGDLMGSFAKSFVFGLTVALIGCRKGLTAGNDAGAVGTATTSAVVTGIVMIAILEGLFAVVFYAMGW